MTRAAAPDKPGFAGIGSISGNASVLRLIRFACAVSALALTAALASAARADEPRAAVVGIDDEELREAVVRAVGEASRVSGSRLETRRRAREAAENAVALLRSEGFYQNRVTPEVSDGEPGTATIRVQTGRRFTLADIRLDYLGEPPIETARTAATAALDLEAGEPGRAPLIVGAEGRAVAALQQNGYADAEAAPREVIVDHADFTVRPHFRIDAGELVRMNGIDLRTEGRTTNQRWVRGLGPWREGDVYDPDDVAELERRLLDTGVYDSVTVALAPESNAEGLRPVIVSLADRPRNLLEGGVSYSTSEGAGLEGRYSRFNAYGRADTLTVTAILAEIQQRLGVQLSLPHFRRAGRTLTLGANLVNERTDAYRRTGVNALADLTQRYGRTTYFTYGASIDAGTIEDFRGRRNLVTGIVLGAFNLDRSNDPLDPRRGWRLEARAEPTLTVGDDNLAYLRATAQYSLYIPLHEGGRTLLAGRVRAGVILNGSIPEVPADRRFFAGGGGSVRGYEYQGIGPRDPSNQPVGGLSLLEGSLELRRDITERFSGAVFVDVGAISDNELPRFDDSGVGVGFGVRYNLPFGPIRADIAFPVNNREGQSAFQIYLSLGQAF